LCRGKGSKNEKKEEVAGRRAREIDSMKEKGRGPRGSSPANTERRGGNWYYPYLLAERGRFNEWLAVSGNKIFRKDSNCLRGGGGEAERRFLPEKGTCFPSGRI